VSALQRQLLGALTLVFLEVRQQSFIRQIERMRILPIMVHHLLQSIHDVIVVDLDSPARAGCRSCLALG
jgi:hypothetical protein